MKQDANDEKIQFDVIIVGAGLAGSAAAMVCARNGLKVALIERGQQAGNKNYFGGAIYTHALEEVLPDLWERKPPFERPVTEAGFWFLTKDNLSRITTQGGKLDNQPADAYIALRSEFDEWWAEQARSEGTFIIPKTNVIDILRAENGQVIGVLTDRPQGEIYSSVVIICEGVNNLLTQKLGLIDHDIEPSKVALGVKQLISLPTETINARFGLVDENHGLAVTVMGDVSIGLTGMGFVYTGKKNVSVGLGMNLDVLAEYRLKPYEVLQRYLSHPAIAPLIKGGRLMEYGAHLIPEGGYKEMPTLYTDGAMIAGDAAAMVNALHWEGTNMAVVAGRLAGETAVDAFKKNDFSTAALSQYKKRLEDGFILQDLKQYRKFSHFLDSHPDFMNVYPGFVSSALEQFFTAYGKPKKQLYKEMLASLTNHKSLFGAASDIISMGKAVMGW